MSDVRKVLCNNNKKKLGGEYRSYYDLHTLLKYCENIRPAMNISKVICQFNFKIIVWCFRSTHITHVFGKSWRWFHPELRFLRPLLARLSAVGVFGRGRRCGFEPTIRRTTRDSAERWRRFDECGVAVNKTGCDFMKSRLGLEWTFGPIKSETLKLGADMLSPDESCREGVPLAFHARLFQLLPSLRFLE